MKEVTKEMIIADVLRMNAGFAPILMNAGMHCLGCPSASGESLADACQVHGIDVDELIEELNSYAAAN